jgi:hypothetical protein
MAIKDIITLSISGYAALVATIVFCWNVYLSVNDKGKIMIGGFFGYAVDGVGSGKVKILYYEFVNSGKRPVIMSSFGGYFRRGQYSNGYSQFIVNVPGLPKKLEPGERFQVTFTEFGSIDDSVKTMVAIDTLGNRYKMSRKLVRHLKKSKREFVS